MTDETAARAKRPRLVWVILAFLVWAVGTQLVASFFLVTRQLPDELLQKLDTFPLVDYIVGFLLMLLYAAAGIALFMLRRVAFALFALSFALSVALALFNLSMRPVYFETMQETYFIALVGRLLIALAIIAYVYRLVKRGILT